MTISKEQKNINLGEKRYDAFVEKTLGHFMVCTPCTYTLEKIGLVKLNSPEFYGLCIHELATNFSNNDFLAVKKGKLYRVYPTETLEEIK